MTDEDLHRICQEVADEFRMGGLMGTVYEEFAIAVARRTIEELLGKRIVLPMNYAKEE